MKLSSPEDFYRRLHEGNPGDIEFYLRTCTGADHVLELGCGWGRVLRRVAKHVGHAWGVDQNAQFVAETKANLDEVSAARVFEGDLTRLSELSLPRATFDRIILPYNTVYALGGSKGVAQCLTDAHPLLASGGEVWFDVYPMDAYQASIDEAELPEDDDEPVAIWETDEGKIRVLESSTIDHKSQHLEVTYRAINDRDELVSTSDIAHDYLLLPQLEELLSAAGFELALAIGGFDGRPYDDEAEQLIIGATAKSSLRDAGT